MRKQQLNDLQKLFFILTMKILSIKVNSTNQFLKYFCSTVGIGTNAKNTGCCMQTYNLSFSIFAVY